MKKILLLPLLFISFIAFANTIIVKNIEELKTSTKNARAGDVIILQNGTWSDVTIALDCNGTKEKPIIFKAQTAGKVIISGNSRLKLGGNFITVDGLYFLNGYAGDVAVINFRIDNKLLANNCRVTNCVVNDFNNPNRLDENNWVLFYGKNNRLDHCSFINKKNLGVLLAVILDDDRSRENFHSIDHNYFGLRVPLASNGGEIIRVGISQHCEFNSNTQITDNYFEHCDGETEIISIKSCKNIVSGNLFKECQGGVVLRHGHYNTVDNNIFLGNDKPGTGGVRVINRGQWVINNLFYKCRGIDFRSPLSVMNGIPNSPAFRYVQVTDAVIAKNTFYNCSPISLCEGSDTERVLPPQHVVFAQNIFYNDRDTSVYKAFDDISGFSFADNRISKTISQQMPNGFTRAGFTTQFADARPVVPVVVVAGTTSLSDSIRQLMKNRLDNFSPAIGFSDAKLVLKITQNAQQNCGASWYKKTDTTEKSAAVDCKNSEEVYFQLLKNKPVTIRLTGQEYALSTPFYIRSTVTFTAARHSEISIRTPDDLPGIFVVAGNGNLSLKNLNINGRTIRPTHFICNDTTESSNHYNVSVRDCSFKQIRGEFFFANKSMVADSVVISGCSFSDNQMHGVLMIQEKDNKGYYNAEKIIITNNHFTKQNGMLLSLYRGGNDESTLGPQLVFANNTLNSCDIEGQPLIRLSGVQQSFIEKNSFTNCGKITALIKYEDRVRAHHYLKDNTIINSGIIVKDKFMEAN